MTIEPLNTEAIRARVVAATPGPWQTMSPRADGRNAVQRPHYGLYGEELSEFLLIDTNPSDAEFIAHARTDIPALLDEIATLRAQLAGAEAVIAEAATLMSPEATLEALGVEPDDHEYADDVFREQVAEYTQQRTFNLRTLLARATRTQEPPTGDNDANPSK